MQRRFVVAILVAVGDIAPAVAQSSVPQCFTFASVDGKTTLARLLKMVRPQYPEVAQTHEIDGNVRMDITIDTDGSVKDIKVTHGLPELIPNAVHAMAQWRYEPARVDGVATPCRATTNIQFQVVPTPAQAATANATSTFTPNRVEPKVLLPPPPEGILRVSSRAMEAQLDKRVEPVYPADAAAAGAQGTVVMLLTVSKSGEVSTAQVLTGPERFRDAALAAVKQWRYKPYLVDGEPHDIQTTAMLKFAPSN